MLARLITAEAGDQPYEGQVAVGTVVMNRLDNGHWGDTIYSVIYYKKHFARPKNYYIRNCYKAAKAVLEGERNLPDYILYFQVLKERYFYGDWHCTIGEHNFYGD